MRVKPPVRIIRPVQATSRISVTLPGAPEYLRLARLATADIGSRAGFGYEEIDDLRIAVSELCTLISGDEGAVLTLEFWFDEASVTVAGEAVPGLVVENQLSRAIVDAVVDDVEIDVSDGIARFRASKRSRSD